jgi:hypothetical protein
MSFLNQQFLLSWTCTNLEICAKAGLHIFTANNFDNGLKTLGLFLDLYETSRKLLEFEIMQINVEYDTEDDTESGDTYEMNQELLGKLQWLPASRDVIRKVLVRGWFLYYHQWAKLICSKNYAQEKTLSA